MFTRPALRTPMLFGWLAAFYNAPEGVAAPFARQLHAGATGVGLLLAAGPGRVHRSARPRSAGWPRRASGSG